MHPELNGVEIRYFFQEFFQRYFGVVGQVIGRYAPHQPRYGLVGSITGAGYAAALHTAPVDMVPDAHRKLNAPRVRHVDQAIQSQ